MLNSASTGKLLNHPVAPGFSPHPLPPVPLSGLPAADQAGRQKRIAAALAPLVAQLPDVTDAHQLAWQIASELLGCVRGNEFNTAPLIGRPFEALLTELPDAVWAELQNHSLTQSPSGITSVTLSPMLAGPLDGVNSPIAQRLNQLPALAHVRLLNPFSGWINLRGLGREGWGEPPRIEICSDSTACGPWKVHVPQGAHVVANAHAAACPGSKVVYFEGGMPAEELSLGGEIIHGGLLPRQAEAQRTLALNALASALAPAVQKLGKGQEHGMHAAQTILACVDGNTLDLTRLSGRENVDLMANLHPAGWDALQRFVLTQTGEGITSVALSRDLCAALQLRSGNTLVAGLNRLTGLAELVIHEPSGRDLKLAGLRIESGLPAIEIRSENDNPGPWTVFVPEGADVSANTRSVATRPSTVVYDDGEGGVRQSVLDGLIYDRKPTDFDMDPDAARAAMFNGKAPGIFCDQLVAKWFFDRNRHRAKQQADAVTGPPPGTLAISPGSSRYSYKNSLSEKAIQASVSPAESAEFLRVWNETPDALFEAGQFGDILAQEFEGMVDGQTRQLLIGSSVHAIGVELRVKNGEYVVNFHDPNATAMHRRLVVSHPSKLRGRSMQDWVGRAGLDRYFGKGNNSCIGSIHRWPAGAKQPVTIEALQRHVPARHRTSPQFLLYLHTTGHSDEAAACVEKMDGFLANALATHASGQINEAQLQALILDRFGDLAGWWAASHKVMAPVFEKYLNWVLQSPLSSEQKWKLLRAGGTGNGDLGVTVMDGMYALLDPFIRVVSNAPDAALEHWYRRALLDVQYPPGDEAGVPLLHHLAYEGFEGMPESAIHAVSRFVGSIVRAQLPLEETAELCGAAYEDGEDAQSAVQLALATGHLRVASTIAFAIQANEPDAQRKDALLARLNVDMTELRAAVSKWVAQRNAAKST